MKVILLVILSALLPASIIAQNNSDSARYRVIIDNDFGGDPDGLVQLGHQLLSPTTEIRAIIGSKNDAAFPKINDPVGKAVEDVNNLLAVMKLEGKYQVFKGSNENMTLDKPVDSDGARAIITEAMKTNEKLPLLVLCGASLSTVASAWLLEPAIADKLTVIWIGGEPYKGVGKISETNLMISIPAAQVIFNKSMIALWQIPRDTYDNCVFSFAEMKTKMACHGELGKFIYDKLNQRINLLNSYFRGETYTMGDSPLVLLSGLQGFYDKVPSSSECINRKAPLISDDRFYIENPNGRPITVFTNIDTRLMFDDLEAKLILFKNSNE
ncbi:nucleoside hydrolase [uncultured Draconibacterium sp.]|uniref:nucleoside hydrolase n=1 Tax=uncultured Draconibacterium sp. TaxID=1573823 RepID=UPI00321721A4